MGFEDKTTEDEKVSIVFIQKVLNNFKVTDSLDLLLWFDGCDKFTMKFFYKKI